MSAAFSFGAAGVYGYVGNRLFHRNVSRSARLPAAAFATWWYALAAYVFLGGVQSALAAFGMVDLNVVAIATLIIVALGSLGLACLLYYVLYLFVGHVGLWKPVAAFYTTYMGVMFYYVETSGPNRVQVDPWSVRLEYAHPPGGPFFVVMVLLLVLPQILAALAYFTLAFRVREPELRYRITVVSWSVVVWFGTPLAGLATGWSDEDWWQWTSRWVGLGAALAILAAYHPPRRLQQWLRGPEEGRGPRAEPSPHSGTSVKP